MEHQFYTGLELEAIETNTDLHLVDVIKLRVSRSFEPEEWNNAYLSAKRLLKALVDIGNYCPSDGDWHWHVPGSPTTLYMAQTEKEIHYPKAKTTPSARAGFVQYRLPFRLEPQIVLDNLPTLHDRNRGELLHLLSVLGSGREYPVEGLSLLRYDVGCDMNKNYIRLVWATSEKPLAKNIIYLHRGRHDKKDEGKKDV